MLLEDRTAVPAIKVVPAPLITTLLKLLDATKCTQWAAHCIVVGPTGEDNRKFDIAPLSTMQLEAVCEITLLAAMDIVSELTPPVAIIPPPLLVNVKLEEAAKEMDGELTPAAN